MRINGEWFECDDGLVRPVVRGEILNVQDVWEPALFLVDTGADCTVFSAAMLDVLGFDAAAPEEHLGGVGGTAPSVKVATRIRLTRADGGKASFRSEYSAFTQLEALDMSVLGRDIMEMFAVIVDRTDNVVTLVRHPHRYVIEPA